MATRAPAAACSSAAAARAASSRLSDAWRLWPARDRHAIEIAGIAVKRFGFGQRGSGLGRQSARVARTETDHARRPLMRAAPSRAPARSRNRARESSVCRRARIMTALRHRAALDIDRPAEPAGAFERAAHFGQIAAEFHHHGGVGVGEPPLELRLGQRCGQAPSTHRRPGRSGRRPPTSSPTCRSRRRSPRSDSAPQAARAGACRSRRTADRLRRSPRPCGRRRDARDRSRPQLVVERAHRGPIVGAVVRQLRA